ncbi:hypothetical protein [Bdellovibrio sp. HCB2-146]|uniref:hypothetical protein n=1 Tax=Bdellovibrio sp. HCB2-146 TaxID=3394362 RepID=UPI0039BD46F0
MKYRTFTIKTSLLGFLLLSLSACGMMDFSFLRSTRTLPGEVTEPSSEFGSRGVSLWNRLRDGDSDDEAGAFLELADGRIWVTGRTSGAGPSQGYLKSFNADGSLDMTFGYQKGNVTAIRPGFISYFKKLVQVGDVVYLAGQTNPGDEDIILARYHLDGTYDTSFNKSGTAVFDLSGNSDYVSDMVIQADGKILIAGQTNENFTVIRVNTDGSLDTGFATAGMFLSQFSPGSSSDLVSKILLQSDGKIILAGHTNDAVDGIGMMRLNADGSLDNTFGTGGKAKTNNASIHVSGAKLLSDGKIIVAGSDGANTVIAQFTTTGALDTSFNTTGYVVRKFSASDNFVVSVDVQTDGKIVVAGFAGSFFSAQAFVARVNADGSTDTTFNTTGYSIFDFVAGQDSSVFQVSVSGTGLFVYGDTIDSGVGLTSTGLKKFTSTGAADTSFNTTGTRVINIGDQSTDIMYSTKRLASGKLLAVGGSSSGGLPEAALIVRYNSDGSVDSTFGTGGAVEYAPFVGPMWEFGDVVEQSDKSIVVLLNYMDAGDPTVRVVRFTENGTLDLSFNTVGYRDIFYEFGLYGSSLALDTNGNIYVATAVMLATDFALGVVKITTAGALDTSFNTTGTLTIDLPSNSDGATHIQILEGGKILLAGRNDVSIDLIRLNSDGSMDATFATAGVYQGNPSGGASGYMLRNVVVKNDKILIAGSVGDPFVGVEPFVLQFDKDGALDTSFGTNGFVQLTSYTDGVVVGGALESDGKVTLGVVTDDSGRFETQLRRLNADGSMDATFNSGNPVTFVAPFGSKLDLATMLQMPDGGYLMGGTASFTLQSDFILLRFTEDGVE